ncbi:TerC family protein [Alsobacter sp. SYSU M60028]|uniref:TerC family protein n=1 Tax=Alsobacter ponti TaxID=2962936 RepID=A0ABT1LHA0_9HYPH|nr:TerC family protein [Alsobacter ponti]MCP8940483.1 TerC family protein [Alsobacter ponti]
MPDFLTIDLLAKPLWMWLVFGGVVSALLAFDLGVLHRGSKEISTRESLLLSAFYITMGLAFGGWVWWSVSPQAGVEYLTGFVIEKSLSMDNIFVIAMIFGYFGIPRAYQYRVLFWGVLAVIVMRGVMIGVGAALVSQFGWLLWLFAAFLIATGVKMLLAADKAYDVSTNPVLKFMRRRFRVTDGLRGEAFVVRERDPRTGRLATAVTPLFLVLVLVNIADAVFAVDSVPAIFAVTTDTYIVFTSNIFAILGLRALYFALSAMIDRFAYLKYALASVLIFIGGKIVVADMLGIAKVPPAISLGATFAILAAGVAVSLWKTRHEPEAALPAPAKD